MTRKAELAGQNTGAGSAIGRATALVPEATPRSAKRSLRDRTLAHYPPPRTRMTCLGIVVLATVVLYYQFFLIGAVSTRVMAEFHLSFTAYGAITVGAAVAGAVASLLAGIADRYGRANIITIGLAIVGLLCLAGVPHVHSKTGFAILWLAIGFVEGVILVATPAMIRDFSPQVGRASAMGFWTLGPVLGSLAVSLQVSRASNGMPWQDHFMIAGVAGLAVSVLSALFLRELAPALRDQLMVSNRDRALIEARAKGIDVDASIRRPFRQMIKPNIVGSALAIWLFLIIYSIAVGFFPVYFQTVFGFSQAEASSLGDWSWAALAGSLLLAGFVSDKLRVRKPFMLAGAVSAIIFTALFALHATQPHTSYATFVEPARAADDLPRRGLRAVDGQLHRDRRAPQPGADRDRAVGVGHDRQGRARAAGARAAARGHDRLHAGAARPHGEGAGLRHGPGPGRHRERGGQGRRS